MLADSGEGDEREVGVVVDFGDALESMLDEVQETYDGRIRSPQGKVIRVQPYARKWHNRKGRWIFRSGVYVSTLDNGMIFQCRLETERREAGGDDHSSWEECLEEMERLTRETESLIEKRGFIIKRGRYVFKGDHITGVK